MIRDGAHALRSAEDHLHEGAAPALVHERYVLMVERVRDRTRQEHPGRRRAREVHPRRRRDRRGRRRPCRVRQRR
jgi:hypothetical protein